MDGITEAPPKAQGYPEPTIYDGDSTNLFCQQWVKISLQEKISLESRANYYQTQHSRSKLKIAELQQIIILKDARIKDLENRLFGKKSEKSPTAKSEKGGSNCGSKRPRGQQPSGRGHGCSSRPNLPVIFDQLDLPEDEKSCPQCGLPHLRKPAWDDHSDEIKIEVRAYTPRYIRFAYRRSPEHIASSGGRSKELLWFGQYLECTVGRRTVFDSTNSVALGY